MCHIYGASWCGFHLASTFRKLHYTRHTQPKGISLLRIYNPIPRTTHCSTRDNCASLMEQCKGLQWPTRDMYMPLVEQCICPSGRSHTLRNDSNSELITTQNLFIYSGLILTHNLFIYILRINCSYPDSYTPDCHKLYIAIQQDGLSSILLCCCFIHSA